MARMTRRIANKINKTKEEQQPKQTKKNYGKDIWLIILIIVNFVLLVVSWQSLLVNPSNFAIYVFLEIVLVLMYITRHAKISEKLLNALNKAQYFCMALILVLFIYNVILYFTN